MARNPLFIILSFQLSKSLKAASSLCPPSIKTIDRLIVQYLATNTESETIGITNFSKSKLLIFFLNSGKVLIFPVSLSNSSSSWYSQPI